MATKRRSLNSQTNLNFRPTIPEISRSETRGTRPTPNPTSIKEVLVMMLMHICKKSIFFDINLKVALYLGSLFLVSLIGDFTPFPRTYFANSKNILNVCFVKLGWAWTLAVWGPFLYMTSCTLCCGVFKMLSRYHLPRLIIATFFWFFWTKLFNILEHNYGRCNIKSYNTKSSCVNAGFIWHSFDISGHAFILIYSSLILMEEARPIIKWDSIREHLRNEFYNRSISDPSSSPLRNLNDREIKNLKYLYEYYTPIIRTFFIFMTILQLLWDIMLVSTMLYYHKMIEKVVSGIIAIITWYVIYRVWYPSNLLPNLPGQGSFIYQTEKVDNIPLRSYNLINTQKGQVPKFMGMPIYGTRKNGNMQLKNESDAS